MMVTCEVVNQLKAGREKVKQGWTKKELRNADKVCALGALDVTSDRDGCYLVDHCKEAIDLLAANIPQRFKDDILNSLKDHKFRSYYENVFKIPVSVIPFFNDQESTTQQDVLDVFDRAIVAAIEQVEQENG